jgi:hypothetical protein
LHVTPCAAATAATKVRAGQAAVLGTHRAAGTLIIGGLSNPAWKVEVEGIAVA